MGNLRIANQNLSSLSFKTLPKKILGLVSLLCFAPTAEAYQLQLRQGLSLFHLKSAKTKQQTAWNAAYLNGPDQVIENQSPGRDEQQLGRTQEISLGMMVNPAFFWELGFANARYGENTDFTLDVYSPKFAGLYVMNVQGRIMPFLRAGFAYQMWQAQESKTATLSLPQSLGLQATEDRFGLESSWEDARFWLADVGLGVKLFPYPTSSLNFEYRYSRQILPLSFREKQIGLSSYRNEAGFEQSTFWEDTQLEIQELSLALEIEM